MSDHTGDHEIFLDFFLLVIIMIMKCIVCTSNYMVCRAITD